MKIMGFTLFLLLGAFAACDLFAGQNTLVVNYPAPQGNYNKVVLQNIQSNPVCSQNNAGMLYYNQTTNSLEMCSSVTGVAQRIPYPEVCFNQYCSWISPANNNCTPNRCPYGYSWAQQGGSAIADSFITDNTSNPPNVYHVKSMICCSCNSSTCLKTDGGSTVSPQS